MNVLQHTRNERNPCLKHNRPDRSCRHFLNYRDILGKLLCDQVTLNANPRETVKRKTLKNTLEKWQDTEINRSSNAISILEIR